MSMTEQFHPYVYTQYISDTDTVGFFCFLFCFVWGSGGEGGGRGDWDGNTCVSMAD